MSLLTAFLRFYFTRSPRNATALRREIKLSMVAESVK
jgi:hypothetical protein